MDKRRAPRYAIALDALVHPDQGRSWLCSIKDFCVGGMLLTEQESTRVRRTAPIGDKGDGVAIHFSIHTNKGEQHFRLEGKIARVIPDGLGIVFDKGMEEEVMTRLLEYSKRMPLSKPPQEPARPKASTPVTSRKAGNKPAAKPNLGLAGATPAKASSQSPARQPAQARSNALQGAGPGADRNAARGGRNNLEIDGANTAAPEDDFEEVEEVEEIEEARLAPQGDISVEDAQRIIAGCRERTLANLKEMNAAFFKYMGDELLQLANEARNNALQGEYFSAMTTLEQGKDAIGQRIIDEVLSQVDSPQEVDVVLGKRQAIESERRQEQESRGIRISLVNTDEFEDWLAVANIISHTERSYEKYLVEVQTRLGMLIEAWSHNEVNPFCPAVIARAFDDVLRTVPLTKDVRERSYYGYEVKVVPIFRKYYISLTKFLDDSGLFPEMDDVFITPGPVKIPEALQTPSEPPQDEQELPEPEAAEQQEYLLDEQLDTGRGSARPSQPQTYQQSHQQPHQQPYQEPYQQPDQEPYQQPMQSPHGRSAGGDLSSALRSVYSTVRSLINPNAPIGEVADGADQYSIDEVQNVLSQLQRQMQSGKERRPVRQQMQQLMADQGMRGQLSPAASENLEVVENLVDNIEQDRLLSTSAKEWIRQLEVILSREATQNPDFMARDSEHGAMEVINQLAHLGSSESGSIKRNVDDIVQRLVGNFDGSPEVFEDALKDLQPLVERQSRAFRGNVQRAVKASEGQQTLVNAQRSVLSEMDQRFGGKEVPELLLKLLMPGWRNLLVNTHLREGTRSADWRRNLHVLDQLSLHLDKNADPKKSHAYMEPALLLKQIETGLDKIAYEPGQRAQLLDALKEMLAEDADTSRLPQVALPEEGLAESLGLTDIKNAEKKRTHIRDELESHPEWKKYLEQAKHLFVGEWLEFIEESQEAEIAIVAWVSDQHDKFVFVNRRGVQTHEFVVEELASMLLNGKARVMDESDIPLSERASHRMLQNMHNKLTHQATHDELTGLANRKEFERELENALKRVKKDSTEEFVAYLDLDQFKVINNTSGHEAGDAMLVRLADVIRNHVNTDVDVLARLGGDEFGILMIGRSEAEALNILEKMAEDIKAFRFDWQGTQYSLTTSMGCVVVDGFTESAQQVMRSADSACYAAKDAGRDRIRMFETEDKKLIHRTDVMEFVAQIDQALENNRFVLNCQKISPIEAGADHLPHYEILLTILNENGEPMPPQDFIIAAETYNRMGAIDRWVIKNSFQWIADHFLQLEKLGAFSINISGNSLNEEDFMDFVLEQFNATHLPTSKICFEITETAAIDSLDGTIEFMEKMKVIGCEFSLDDFGTGLSSYSYLRNLPVDYLKIDGIFVKDIASNPNDYAVVKSINEIGHFMGKKTIAEYVENEEVLEILREIGVDFAQGYGIEKKMPIDQLL